MQAKMLHKLMIAMVVVATVATGVSPLAVSAGQIATRSVTMSDPTVSNTATNYSHTFTVPTTGTVVQGLQFLACTTAFGTCTAPGSGFTYAGAATGSNPTTVTGTGFGTTTNWVKDASSSANDTRYTYAANATTPSGATTFAFGGVTNISTANTPVYIRIYTYANGTPAGWNQTGNGTGVTDTGNVVAVATAALTVTGTVQEQLQFCVYNTGGSCGAGVTGSVQLPTATGILSAASNSTNTSQFQVITNANGGVNITYAATAFTGPGQTIGNTGARGATITPTAGTESFALSLTGVTSTLAATAPYNSIYNFQGNNTPDSLATATATAGAIGTVTYAANISTTTKPGIYTSVIDYQAIGTF